MALFLIQQTELESSKWKPYIDALPTQFDTTIYWNEEELQELDGSLIKEFTEDKKESVKNNYADLLKVVQKIKEATKITLDEYKWAVSVIWSRTFSVTIEGHSVGALIPIADMFNNEDPDQIKIKEVGEGDGMKMVADKLIKRGEQIFVPYGNTGSKPNGQLLMDYGFALANPNNTMIMIHSLLSSSQDETYEERERRKLLTRYGLDSDHVPLSKLDSLANGRLLTIARILQMNGDELGRNPDPRYFVGNRNEKAAIRILLVHLRKVLGGFGDEDEENETEAPLRQKMAKIAKREEIKLLKGFKEELEFYRENIPKKG
eukprot:TRINITY_DN4267_c0_g1_i3.p1 TRINITY_DN4267_c0_g1~~TRINITY_DN4267_c0_g1_i3.p1  ORF type:complete len:318 (+),score=86.93 TRINITY_DN4267_c0_g1_i3:442-1395(+)